MADTIVDIEAERIRLMPRSNAQAKAWHDYIDQHPELPRVDVVWSGAGGRMIDQHGIVTTFGDQI